MQTAQIKNKQCKFPKNTLSPTRLDPGMDQGSDLISDFRARRILTPITWEILSANCHEVTEFCIAGSGTASAGAGSGNKP